MTEYFIGQSSDNLKFILPLNLYLFYSVHGLFEHQLIEWVKTKGNIKKNFLDIGAHTGTYAVSLSPFFNHIYAFEPQRMTYYALCGNMAINNLRNVSCYNFGLGSHEQSLTPQELCIISEDGGGSTLFPHENPILSKEIIQIRTIDSLNLENIGFIKMDIENNEIHCLRGALNTITRCKPDILFEANNLDEFIHIKKFLESIGYQVKKIQGHVNMFFSFYYPSNWPLP